MNFAPTGVVPFGSEVEISDCDEAATTLDGKRGRWCRAIYRDLKGYCFSGFLSDDPGGSPAPHPEPRPIEPPPRKKPRPRPAPRVAAPRQAAVKSNSPRVLAYAVYNPPGLTKLSLKEFKAARTSLAGLSRYRKEDFRASIGVRGESESVQRYLQRSADAKRAFLEKVRKAEYTAATKIYSIYDAPLVAGEYSPALHRFDFLGTTIALDPAGEATTLPDAGQLPHGFENGRVLNVTLPAGMAKLLRENPDSVLVRLDFSYAVSLQNLFAWTSRTYFLPRYLMLYDRKTGRIYYECAAAPRVERETDPALPLKISSHFLYEKTHWP